MESIDLAQFEYDSAMQVVYKEKRVKEELESMKSKLESMPVIKTELKNMKILMKSELESMKVSMKAEFETMKPKLE